MHFKFLSYYSNATKIITNIKDFNFDSQIILIYLVFRKESQNDCFTWWFCLCILIKTERNKIF